MPTETSIPAAFEAMVRSCAMPFRAKVWIEHLNALMRRAVVHEVAGPDAMDVLRSADLSLRHAAAQLELIGTRSMALMQDVASAEGDVDRRGIMEMHLVETVKDWSVRKEDIRALDRWLDLEGLVDREIQRAVAEVQLGILCLDILRGAFHRVEPSVREAWCRKEGLLPLLLSLTVPTQRPPLREEALLTVADWLNHSPSLRDLVPVDGIVAVAQERKEPTWVQVAAIRALGHLHPASAADVVWERLSKPAVGDDFLVRRNAMVVAAHVLGEHFPVSRLVIVRNDPSEHVRQSFADELLAIGSDDAAAMAADIACSDAAPRVRAWSLRGLVAHVRVHTEHTALATDALRHALASDKSGIVLQVAIDGLVSLRRDEVVIDVAAFVPLLTARTDGDPDVAERSAAALRTLELLEDPLASEIREQVVPLLANLREFKSAHLPLLPSPENDVALMRALRDCARGDMSVGATREARGYRILRGEKRGRRLWRVLRELRHWAPDKRSGFAHTRARISEGDLMIPPIGMSEVTPTPVPGERVLVKQLAGWGPFLPRVDDLLTACTRTTPTYIATSSGIVTLTPPPTAMARWRAFWKITWDYETYAATREQSLGAVDEPDRRKFADLAAELGFRFTRDVEPGTVSGVSYAVKMGIVANFFPTAAPLVPVILGPVAYFASHEGNSPIHLVLLTVAIYAWVLINAAWVQRGIDIARNSIPLRIGGWGTRGKSGTERLKAGLFQGLGCNVVSKTTGCEAMFIHAVPWQRANEIFLFRPYDKPTIWEQRDVLRTGQAMKAQVFLWECMALRPNFVQLLGRRWMRDEITTLTNAYPDHEDVMGPNGEEVARVIGIFMAVGGTTYTTEIEMLPVLREAALSTNTTLRELTPLEGDLITEDLLVRFPYDEHPRNISLVIAVARHLGLDRERSLVEMADNVVPDLGVLKTYPRTTYRGRSVQFSNGMSANERAGFLSCWTRLLFDKSDPDVNPLDYIITVVNNRADRVPRSRVFARIVVRDADRHGALCIGTNLTGLHQFIQEELEELLAELWVADENFNPADPATVANMLARHDATMKRVKVAANPEVAIRLQLTAILKGCGVPAEAAEPFVAALDLDADVTDKCKGVLDAASVDAVTLSDGLVHVTRQWTKFHTARQARARLVEAKTPNEANQIFRDVYRKIFMDQVQVLWNTFATGDQVADTLALMVPPGHNGRIMGVQNIKGTGLDFVYRWLSLDVVCSELKKLVNEPLTAPQTLAWLSSYTYGIVECEHARAAMAALVANVPPELKPHEEKLVATLEHLTKLKAKLGEGLGEAKKPSRLEQMAEVVEPWIDFVDSMGRRRKADRVQRDFIDKRVGHLRAAEVMRELTKRDKGGWFVKWVKTRLFTEVRAVVATRRKSAQTRGSSGSPHLNRRASFRLRCPSTSCKRSAAR